MMQIVIDIDERVYRRIQKLVRADQEGYDLRAYAMQTIANGTPLPKGHEADKEE